MIEGNSYYSIGLNIIIKSGVTVNNLVFKPMIRLATIKDDTYVPYAPTNAKLNEEKMSYADNGILGAKNLIPYPYYRGSSFETNGITFTVNADGSVTANGTATDYANFSCTARDVDWNLQVNVGDRYILSGSPAGSDSSHYWMAMNCKQNDSTNTFLYVYEDEEEFVLPASDAYYGIILTIKSGVTVSNLTFYPMLRLASDPDDTYQPYAMTNKELTDKLIPSVVSVDRDTTTTNTANIRLYRYGSLRILTGVFNPSVAGTSATNTHIADLPLATDRPTYNAICPCGRGETDSSATAKMGSLNIGTDGTIKYQGQATGENMFFNVSWLVGV